jgi:ribonuclease Z
MSNLVRAFQFDIKFRQADDLRPPEGAVVLAHDINQGVVYESGGVKVTAFDVDHGPVKPALGYRIDYGGHSVALSGDTRYSENLIRFAQGVDVLVHEVCLADPETLKGSEHERHVMAHHISPERAAEVFTRVKPKLAVYSHIVLLGDVNEKEILSLTRKTYSGPLEMGEDLMVIEIGREIKVRRAGDGPVKK